MSKVFYLTLIIILSTSLAQIQEIYVFWKFCRQHAISFLFVDFYYLETSLITCSIIVSLLFIAYKYNRKIIFPILITIGELLYLSFAWSTIFCYYSDPINFLQRRKSIWDNYIKFNEAENIYSRYNCCGFDENDKPEICQIKKLNLSCTRKIFKLCAINLNYHFSNCFFFSFIHVFGIAVIWIYYNIGEVNYDQLPINKLDSNYEALIS